MAISRIETEIASVQAKQADLFREAFPDMKVPGAVLRTVRSEHTRVASWRGQNVDIEISPSATMILREILNALPVDVRFKVQDIDIVDGVVDLTLLVKISGDASIIANAIGARGFEVELGRVSRPEEQENQWTVPISATWMGRESKPEVSG